MAYRLQDLKWDLRKALSLPPGESLRRLSGRAVRAVRRVRNRSKARPITEAELIRASVHPVRRVEELLERRREGIPLLPGAREAGRIAAALRRDAPASLEPILAAARRIGEGWFDLLGSGPVRLGRDPDWHRDFGSGHRWDPRAFSLEIRAVPDAGSDIKNPWELARLQHLGTLGIASVITGDPGAARLGADQVRSFAASNPAYRGVNWSCTMDVALRAAGILAAEPLLRAGGADPVDARVLGSLLAHARFIADNLEDGPVRGNHYLSDLSGLYVCALALPEFREASDWRELARTALAQEMARQVDTDGLDFEASTSYHALVTEMLLLPALIGEARGDPFPPEYLRRVGRMVGIVADLLRPDGTLPQIGDNDDGRFLIVSQYHRSRRDWRPLLALGGWLFRNPSWLARSGEAWVEAAWVAGEPFLAWRRGLEETGGGQGFPTRFYTASGLAQIGSGPVSVVVDAGGVGQGGNGGHAHNDTLGFDLFAFGREVLPDRGTGCYTPDRALRDRFRSTRSHNTVQVDGVEINPIPDEPFRLIPADAPRIRRSRKGDRWIYLEAEHAGYRRLPEPITHLRAFLLDARTGRLVVRDRFEGEGRHRFEAGFHLAPGWSAETGPGGWIGRDGESGAGVRFAWIEQPAGVEIRREEDRHSPSYGVVVPSVAVRVGWTARVPCRVVYELTLFPGRDR